MYISDVVVNICRSRLEVKWRIVLISPIAAVRSMASPSSASPTSKSKYDAGLLAHIPSGCATEPASHNLFSCSVTAAGKPRSVLYDCSPHSVVVACVLILGEPPPIVEALALAPAVTTITFSSITSCTASVPLI